MAVPNSRYSSATCQMNDAVRRTFGQDAVLACFADVQPGQAAGAAEQAERDQHEPLATHELHQVAPQVDAVRQVVEVVDHRETGGRESAHGVERGVDEAAVVAGQVQRDGGEVRCDQPRQGDGGHRVAPVEVPVGGQAPLGETAEEQRQARADHKSERVVELAARRRAWRGSASRDPAR
jgi:hypothetical protein